MTIKKGGKHGIEYFLHIFCDVPGHLAFMEKTELELTFLGTAAKFISFVLIKPVPYSKSKDIIVPWQFSLFSFVLNYLPFGP